MHFLHEFFNLNFLLSQYFVTIVSSFHILRAFVIGAQSFNSSFKLCQALIISCYIYDTMSDKTWKKKLGMISAIEFRINFFDLGDTRFFHIFNWKYDSMVIIGSYCGRNECRKKINLGRLNFSIFVPCNLNNYKQDSYENR